MNTIAADLQTLNMECSYKLNKGQCPTASKTLTADWANTQYAANMTFANCNPSISAPAVARGV